MAATVQRKAFEWRQVRVVGLIIAGVLVFLLALYRVGKIYDVFEDRYSIVTLLPNVAGLREGAVVTLAGQRVGKIEEINFIPMRQKRGQNHLLVKLEVGEKAREQIRTDSRAQVRAQGAISSQPSSPA